MKPLLSDLDKAIGMTLTRIEYTHNAKLLEFNNLHWYITMDDEDRTVVDNKNDLLRYFSRFAVLTLGLMEQLELDIWEEAIKAQQRREKWNEYQRLKREFPDD